jgi:glutamine synthetase
VLTDHVALDGEPAAVCQRSFLERMATRLAEHGLSLRAAFESEFSLATRQDGQFVPIDSGLCFSTISTTAAQDYVEDLAAALEAQGSCLSSTTPSLVTASKRSPQGPPCRPGDEQLLVRETIHGIAARHGLIASLAPKPLPQYWAGAYVCWGHDNREAPVRVASVFRGSEEASTNAELKPATQAAIPIWRSAA